MKNTLKLLFVTSLFCSSAFGKTGKELLDWCQYAGQDHTLDSKAIKDMWCIGFISGVIPGYKEGYAQAVVDSDLVTEAKTETKKERRALPSSSFICLPQGVTVEDEQKVVLLYLRERPEKLREMAAPLVVEALRKQFPCKN